MSDKSQKSPAVVDGNVISPNDNIHHCIIHIAKKTTPALRATPPRRGIIYLAAKQFLIGVDFDVDFNSPPWRGAAPQ
jgi:hypothetical protein